MEKSTIIGILLSIFMIAACTISFATKGVMLQNAPNSRTYSELALPEVYRSLEGLICIDAILVAISFVTMFLLCKPYYKALKVIEILLVITIVARFILGVTFLAGGEDFCSQRVQEYDEMTADEVLNLPTQERSFYVTLKGAWVFEIIAIVLTDMIGSALFVCVAKKRKSLDC